MINLIHGSPSEAEVAVILAATAGRPSLPPFGDPVWNTARENPVVAKWAGAVTQRALAEADEPLPALTDELYADFFKTGNRLPFETPYFERRRRLGRAAMGLLLGDETARARLLPSLLRKLGDIMDEVSWSLPAHVWAEPTGKNPMQIDLFAAECANNLAELLVVFERQIPAGLARRIRERLRIQIFENFADSTEERLFWRKNTNNWNAVCHQGVLGAALAIETDHALVARMLLMAARSLPVYLTGFGDDGSTSEGPGYWSYGFGWFSELNAQLEHRAQGRLSYFEGDAKIAAIARFAPLMTLADGHLVNFSDGGRTGRLGPSLLTYLGTRLHDKNLLAQGAVAYRDLHETGLDLDDLRRDFFNMTRIALRTPPAAVVLAAIEPRHPDVYFPDYGAIVARGTDSRGHRWEFSAKGGHNDEHHNHNDCGSFLLNIDGAPALIEIGAPEYTRAFFSDKRYEDIAARSLGHSVPLVNGVEQAAGRSFGAPVIKADVGRDRVEFIVDLAAAYPAEARIKKLVRTFVFEKTAGLLTITDAYELDGPGKIESFVICQDPVTRDGDAALIASPRVTLRIAPSPGAKITDIESCPYRGHKGTDEKIERLRVAPETNSAEGTTGYSVLIS